ncbi:MAG: hypothetical protein UV73_C0002G0061 [Candidatus Gottesmanbacteria bacterium GW2011_GWA2_43_14]|uniref:Asl1-like glycosyl hydrolase catalytic domain-containing protein n=1 Tax=Candidatus Gottesmanbacteria bacterium GW2011_GWA2_43_14 TaxID=1618443 RepID=A0A0G1DL86_9BACT|nr:MAG: hypothetical protein UV73_C0002G0061 [Candidatus Gottesmanbacteria bacterium GW2011_GWA2_43_14]
MTILLSVLLFIFLLNPGRISAVYDPVSRENNKYGIHIIDENDLESASALVNSSGGDWGYVTMVMPENERKEIKWNETFDRMKRLHLIPIIRLATRLEGDTWKKPEADQAEIWSEFLDSLNWPVQNRYLILFNEPNHSKEWGGELDPEGYADILDSYSRSLKNRSDDFFILPAGLDASANNSRQTMDETSFLAAIFNYKKEIFDAIDGWTSHSYPNPHFTGDASDRGRGTVANFVWELNLLNKWGITRNLPVFITETGWPHNAGGDNYLYSPETISDFINETDRTVWTDSRIAAITPFILNYQSFPFASFSWQKLNSDKFHIHFDTYRSLVKIDGKPLLYVEEPTPPAPVIKKEYLSENKGIRLSSWQKLISLAVSPIRQILKLI